MIATNASIARIASTDIREALGPEKTEAEARALGVNGITRCFVYRLASWLALAASLALAFDASIVCQVSRVSAWTGNGAGQPIRWEGGRDRRSAAKGTVIDPISVDRYCSRLATHPPLPYIYTRSANLTFSLPASLTTLESTTLLFSILVCDHLFIVRTLNTLAT